MLVIHRASPVDGPIDGEDQEQGGEGDDGLPQGEAGGEPDILPSRQEVDQDAQAPRAQKRPDGDQEGAERPRREHILPDDGGDEGNDGEGEGVEPLKRPPDQDVAEETHDQGENGPPAGPLVHGLHGRQDGVEERGQPPDADVVQNQSLEGKKEQGGKGVDRPLEHCIAFWLHGVSPFGVSPRCRSW